MEQRLITHSAGLQWVKACTSLSPAVSKKHCQILYLSLQPLDFTSPLVRSAYTSVYSALSSYWNTPITNMSRAAPNNGSSRKISFNVSEQYDIQDVVGEGAYGVVWYVRQARVR